MKVCYTKTITAIILLFIFGVKKIMNKTITICAHVDAGKTTLAEQILYQTKVIRQLGRVDHKSAFLDSNEIEKERGITIFSDQAMFTFNNDNYFLIDTPGHIDFSAEAERALKVCDYAILVINGATGIQAHTMTLFHLLRTYKIPIFFFVNKMDQIQANQEFVLTDIANKLKITPTPITSLADISMKNLELVEVVAQSNDNLLEHYLNDTLTDDLVQQSFIIEFQQQNLFPLMAGSALTNQGIQAFLTVLAQITPTTYETNQPFQAAVYKIRHNEQGERVTYLKCLAGSLQVKSALAFPTSGSSNSPVLEKINQIRYYSGSKYINADEISVGVLVGVTGLKTATCGDIIGENFQKSEYLLQPTLTAKLLPPPNIDIQTILNILKILEMEDPLLQVNFHQQLSEIQLHIMGEIQIEVLQQHILNRFNLEVQFEKPEILYKETILEAIVGFGHFEPLRHYSETHILIEPAPRNSGILIKSSCSPDILPMNFQNNILESLKNKVHLGALTGSTLTDVQLTLIIGRAHEKHTSGGDFRECSCRAVRQGLRRAKSVLLEPIYEFTITCPTDSVGKILADIQKLQGSFNPPIQDVDITTITGRGPVATFMSYPLTLNTQTKGAGSIFFKAAGYDVCHNADDVIIRKNYNFDGDLENPANSVFCAKGQSFIVPWNEAEKWMHCL
jgi:small GTP-binding protein domain